MKYRSVAIWPDTVNVGDPTGPEVIPNPHPPGTVEHAYYREGYIAAIR